jgi:uncharacterized membrane protein YeaQ/YmgE (transglycosylase-associated protein family)
MGILAWIIAGQVAGFIASKIVGHRGQHVAVDALLGMAGAFAAGLVFDLIGNRSLTEFNPWGLLVEVLGAMVTLLVWHIAANLWRQRRVPATR